MSRKYYLAYGSNLDVVQMQHRCPGAKLVGKTTLQDYRLTFRGNSHCGVANIEPRKGSTVPIGIWSITEKDERNLDFYEGFPRLYYKQEFIVELPDLRKVPAMAYIMTPGRTWSKPTFTYLNTIRRGYDDFNFDPRRLLYAAKHPIKTPSR